MPLPIARTVPVGPVRRFLRLKVEYRHRIIRGVCPNTNAISRLYQIGMRIEASVHQSDGYAFAGESGIGVQAEAGRQHSEGGLCIQRPCRLNRFMQGRVAFGQQSLQEVLLNASWTRAVLAIPIGIPTGFGQQGLAHGIPTHGA